MIVIFTRGDLNVKGQQLVDGLSSTALAQFAPSIHLSERVGDIYKRADAIFLITPAGAGILIKSRYPLPEGLLRRTFHPWEAHIVLEALLKSEGQEKLAP